MTYIIKPKHTCGDRSSNARCVFYDLNTPSFSKLSGSECTTIEETTSDLYNLVSWLRESVNVEGLDIKDLEIQSVQDSYDNSKQRLLVKDILSEIISQVDDIKKLTDLNDTDSGLVLDLKCLGNSCGPPITSLKYLLQTLIDEVCTLKTQ